MSLPKFYSSRSQSFANVGGTFRLGSNVSSTTTLALNSAYTYGTGGVAATAAFVMPETLTLEAVYIAPSAITGTGSADGNIDWELREGTTATANVPGTTVVASGTIAVSALAANTWYKYTLPSSKTITAYKRYDFVIGDADGSATNFVTINQHIRETGQPFFIASISTTNGFTSAPTVAAYQPTVALKFTDGTVIGGAIMRGTTSVTNNTNLRGIKFSFPATGPRVKLTGVSFHYAGVFRLLKGASALPNTAAEKEWTFSANFPAIGNSPTGLYCFTEEESYTFDPGETYFALWKPNSTNTTPTKTTAFSGMDSDLRSLLGGFNGMTCSHVQEATSTTWTEDTDAITTGTILCVPIISPTIAL